MAGGVCKGGGTSARPKGCNRVVVKTMGVWRLMAGFSQFTTSISVTLGKLLKLS